MAPSPAVAELMAPVTAGATRKYMVGVHIRQGDAYDTDKKYFFKDRSGLYGASADGGAFVEKFLAEMDALPLAKGKQGQIPTVFFIAADQLGARRACVARFGGLGRGEEQQAAAEEEGVLKKKGAAGRVLQIAPAWRALARQRTRHEHEQRQPKSSSNKTQQQPGEEAGGEDEELARRDSLEDMQQATAEWLLLSECKRMIRSKVRTCTWRHMYSMHAAAHATTVCSAHCV
jgi:hypothetical protein